MKHLYIAAAIMFFTLPIMAQEAPPAKKENRSDERNRFHFGVKLGVNNSNVFDEEGEELIAEPKYGFAGGIYLSIPAGKFFGLQPGALVSQKGFHATGKLHDDHYDLKRTTTYVDVPLLIEFKPIKALTIVAGPQYSYLFYRTDLVRNGNSTSLYEHH